MRLDTPSTTSSSTRTRGPSRKRKRPGHGRILPESDTLRRRSRAAAAAANGSAVAGSHGAARATEATGRRLTADQLRTLEHRLLDERSRALRAIWVKRGDIEDHRETGSLDEVEMDIRMAERHSGFITLIDRALRRLRDAPELFDVSEVSGARIPFERLEIVPWTRCLTEEADPFPG